MTIASPRKGCAGKPKSQRIVDFGTAWLRDRQDLTEYLQRKTLRVAECSLRHRWDMLNWYNSGWLEIIARHDSFQDQGARRIDRRTVERHTAYGDGSWNRAYSAQDDAFTHPV